MREAQEKPRLAVILEGGMVQAIIGTGAFLGMVVTVIDYDIDGADDDEVTEVEQGDGSVAGAYVAQWTVTNPEIVIPAEGEKAN